MRQTIVNQAQENEIGGASVFTRLILALQSDMVFFNQLQQDSSITAFPPVPEFGGIFKTTKGAYEAIWTDDPTPIPQWRRLSDGTVYQEGDAIPTTL